MVLLRCGLGSLSVRDFYVLLGPHGHLADAAVATAMASIAKVIAACVFRAIDTDIARRLSAD
jgi:hypothetical protein